MTHSPDELAAIYRRRFEGRQNYRARVWQVLLHDFFQSYIGTSSTVLDLGCGQGEFINQVRCGARYAMDLNPASAAQLDPAVRLLAQDCSSRWELDDDSLDVVFTSNFFEHLPDKRSLASTLAQAQRCLRTGGLLIALGPNIRYLPGAYWDFWDHYLPLTETSLSEGLTLHGFEITRCLGRFLPFSMVNAPEYPLAALRLYLRLPLAWRIFGKQFLVVARKHAE